ncbi:DUF4215 domain-containing protein [bacterium]|nr:DUF4215 domain-containing protein [bacterium]
MKRILLAILSIFLLEANVTSAAPLQLCVKADRVAEGQPREGSKIVLRSECKKRSNETPIEVSIGTSDSLGGGGDSCGSPAGYYRISRTGFSDVVEISEGPAVQEYQLTFSPYIAGIPVGLPPFTCTFGATHNGAYAAECPEPYFSEKPYWTRPECGTFIGELRMTRVDALSCGDELIFTGEGEVCDDGNQVSGDGCSADCLSDETCANGIHDPAAGEICDDGNTDGGDGCRADCLSDETCGNGVTDPSLGEECDDDNPTEGDGCDSNCTWSRCGNGILANDEACDDGNTDGGDGCSADCLSDETCGNGIVDVAAGEECDGGEYCNPDCTSACNLSGIYSSVENGFISIRDDNLGTAVLEGSGIELSYTTREPGSELTGLLPMQILSCAPVSMAVCTEACIVPVGAFTLTWTGPLPEPSPSGAFLDSETRY